MAILSKRLMTDVDRAYRKSHGLRVHFMDLSGVVVNMKDELAVLSNTRRRRNYALQQSIDRGEPYLFRPAPDVVTWVIGLEDRRRIHGAMLSTEVLAADIDGAASPLTVSHEYLVRHGMAPHQATAFLAGLPVWPEARMVATAAELMRLFYDMSGWQPTLSEENRIRARQQAQFQQAIEHQKAQGAEALYTFEKERVLLANIRSGSRNDARRILNEMLATIYLSSPQLVVLRARTVELMSYLTRAAIEDNPLLEPLMARNHTWTERLIAATDFESLSELLMTSLDEFIDGVYLHGVNRSNKKVSRALDYLSRHHAEPVKLKDVADHVGLSTFRLSHLVKDYTGSTVLQHLQQIRIQQARHLLERTELSCTEVAYEVGYGDQSYFIKHFRRLTGTTPARYRHAR